MMVIKKEREEEVQINSSTRMDRTVNGMASRRSFENNRGCPKQEAEIRGRAATLQEVRGASTA